MNEYYGVKGPVHTLKQRKLWNIGLEHLPNHESFDVEFSSSGHVLRITDYSMGAIAIGSEHFDYDGFGKLIRCVEIDASGRETCSSDFVHESQESRLVIKRKPSGEVVSRIVEAYEGNLLLSHAMYDEKDRLKREKTFQYDGNKLTKSDSRYYLPDGTLCEQCISGYDSKGRIARTYCLKADGTPLGDGKYIYEYDDEGRLGKVWSFNEFADEDRANAVTSYEYETDEFGNWVERREFHQSRGYSHWSKRITTRKLAYYPLS
jgi:hypothetical protein